MSSAEGKTKIQRRRRADLDGYMLSIAGAEAPPPVELIYAALYEAYREWRRRTGRDEEGGDGDNDASVAA